MGDGKGIEGLRVMGSKRGDNGDSMQDLPLVVDNEVNTAAVQAEVGRQCGDLPEVVQSQEYADRVAQLRDHGDLGELYCEDPRRE
jgi:hypothetical protein